MTQRTQLSRKGLLALGNLLVGTFGLYGQSENWACGHQVSIEPEQIGGGQSSQTCEEIILSGGSNYMWWRRPQTYVPGPDDGPDFTLVPGFHLRPTAVKTAMVSVIVWKNSDGNGNMNDSQNNRDRIGQVIQALSNDYFSNVELPSDPAVDIEDYYLQDSRLRFSLVGVEFVSNSTYAAMVCSDNVAQEAMSDYVDATYPSLLGTIKIHVILPNAPGCGGPANLGAGSGPAIYGDIGNWYRNMQLVVKGTTPNELGIVNGFDSQNLLLQRIAHEMGHVFGLNHPYDSESLTGGNQFLSDLFSCYQQNNPANPWCNSAATTCGNPTPQFCYFNASSFPNDGVANCDPFLSPFDDCSNNLMGGNRDATSITNLQMGRMHRNAMTTNVSKYVWGYNPTPFRNDFIPVDNNIVQWPLKFYQDIYVKSGTTLILKCTLEMVPEARIVVEPGGRLVIDGGLIRSASYASQTWRGIEVWGNPSLSQEVDPGNSNYLLNQGLVEFINGGRVENAEIGVLLGSRDNPGTAGGGVIRAYGTNGEPIGITNCMTGLKLDPYAPANSSILHHVAFTRDEEALPGTAGSYLLQHIYMQGVTDLQIEGCIFSNEQPDLSTAVQLGNGIRCINSSLDVLQRCADGSTNCATAALTPSRFVGLNHGVWMEGETGGSSGTVVLAEFENEQIGILARGVSSLLVAGCQFNNEPNDPGTYAPYGIGIRSLLSGLVVRPRCADGTTNCANAALIPSRFEGLNTGIWMQDGPNGTATGQVLLAEFENNLTGLRANTMQDVDVRGCSFANSQPGLTTSTQLGQGITSVGSILSVVPGCPDGTVDCEGATLVRNTFTKLDHGIELIDYGTSSYATIQQTDFTNNICGIYANGMTGFAVTNNQFTVGDNQAELTGLIDEQFLGYQRALFSTVSYGFVIRDNTLLQATTGQVEPMDGTEGIVVGYTRDHNDVVFRNQSFNLERAYVGEGICADVEVGNNYRFIGLQFLCNNNNSNTVNFWSRKIIGFDDENDHTIRGFQGYKLEADNRFDRSTDDDRWDFYVSTTFTPITYLHRTPISSAGIGYVPISVDPLWLYAVPSGLFDYESPCRPPVRVPLTFDEGDGSGLAEGLGLDRLEYGNTKYIYDQLVDGGSMDEVVQEITSTWPNEAWQLRQYLLDLSPFLSTESLKEAVNKPYFPMAMKAEVCIANPDATQKEGFIKWLELYANEPMPAYLIDLIRASWEERTFRTSMELDLADQHTGITQAVNELNYLEYQKAQPSVNQVRWAWQQIRTTAARYAEANVLLNQGNYSEAFAVIEDMPVDHDLKASQASEQQRMLSYITLLSNAATNSRDAANLTAAEVAQLQGLSAEHYDRPANWISNLLCAHYGECRSPRTGGEFGGDKSRPMGGFDKPDAAKDEITLAPNPTQTWSTVTYNLVSEPSDGLITVKDATGRVLLMVRMAGKEGQVVLDTRGLSTGVYLVECSSKGLILQTDRLIVQ